MSKSEMQKADFGGGCFWGVEETFARVPGVTKTEVGYEGGHVDHPTYEQVVSHTTGHAETVQVTFDPGKVSYHQLLKVFFGTHDPTTPNQQGPNIGENYRSVIFHHSDEQKKEAEDCIQEVQKMFKRPIVTQVVPAATFWPAEEYHQKFLRKHNLGVCY